MRSIQLLSLVLFWAGLGCTYVYDLEEVKFDAGADAGANVGGDAASPSPDSGAPDASSE